MDSESRPSKPRDWQRWSFMANVARLALEILRWWNGGPGL